MKSGARNLQHDVLAWVRDRVDDLCDATEAKGIAMDELGPETRIFEQWLPLFSKTPLSLAINMWKQVSNIVNFYIISNPREIASDRTKEVMGNGSSTSYMCSLSRPRFSFAITSFLTSTLRRRHLSRTRTVSSINSAPWSKILTGPLSSGFQSWHRLIAPVNAKTRILPGLESPSARE
ncbi:uncharacterized protein IWZ02DRAFT_191940 [Phyllosticta citriasiana]|uniref:uncharacterized protein n=1 Tax=Phyllosticta citriasiana TaxID=595635 RepID=UPI0030FDC5AE